jgi:hypothetical protein
MKRHYLCNCPRVRGGTTGNTATTYINSNKNRLGTFVNGLYLPPEIPALINEFLPDGEMNFIDKGENIHGFPTKEFRIHPKRNRPAEIPTYWDDPPAPEPVRKPDMPEASPYRILHRGVPDVTDPWWDPENRRRGPGGKIRRTDRSARLRSAWFNRDG